MVNLIQIADAKPTGVAMLQGFTFRDAPFHQRILIAFASLGFVGGNADIVQRVLFCFELIDFFCNQVSFELSCTPSDADAGPTVSAQRYTHLLTVGNTGCLLLGFFKHEVFKALGMAKDGDGQPALALQVLFQLLQMSVHFRKFHTCICEKHNINGHLLFNHHQQHTC